MRILYKFDEYSRARRQKFDLQVDGIKENVDALVILEIKFDDTFRALSLLSRKIGGTIAFINEDIPSKLLDTERRHMDIIF